MLEDKPIRSRKTPYRDNIVATDSTKGDMTHPDNQGIIDTPLFEVQVLRTIGTVTRGGKLAPEVAAFTLIAEYGQDGEFNFPNGNGGNVHVNVEWNTEITNGGGLA